MFDRLFSAVTGLARVALALAALTVALASAPLASAQSLVTPAPDLSHEILSVTFNADTDWRSQSRLTSGNRFELLEWGATSYPRKLALIATATADIFVCTMQWGWDVTGIGYADALIAKQRAGVSVRCVVDGLVADPRIVRRLRQGGVKVARYNFLGLGLGGRSGRVHEKLLCVDFSQAIVGGMNMGDDYNLGAPGNAYYHDVDMFVQGFAAGEVARRFLSLYVSLEAGDAGARALLAGIDAKTQQPAAAAPAGPGFGRHIYHEPDLGKFYLTDYYRRCFEASKRQIVWHVKYTAPREPLLSALEGAAARGVRVVLITNSPAAYAKKSGDFAGYFVTLWTRAMLKARLKGTGIEIWETDQYLHSKVVTVDGVMASVGSYNFDRWSMDLHTEQSLIVHDPTVVNDVERMFDRNIATCQRIQ